MDSGRPQKVAINHDDYHAEHIGRTKTGLQFFLTTPFEPVISVREGCEYIALFKFDAGGNLSEYSIDNIGPRGPYNEEERKENICHALTNLVRWNSVA